MKKATLEGVINKLQRQKKLGNPSIIFLGAGASVTSGIPLSNRITDHIKQNYSYSVRKETDDYFKIMSELYPADRKRIFKHFIEGSRINETHLITALLMYLGYVDIIITTNFDPLIKRAANLLKLDPTIIDIPNNVKVSSHSISVPAIYYLHGENSNVWQLNTVEEFQKSKVGSEINSILSNLSLNRTWIVVGYSGNDPVFNVLAEFEKFEDGLFWVGYNNEKPENHVIEKLLNDRTKNAFYISGYDSDNFFKELVKGLDITNPALFTYVDKLLTLTEIEEDLHRNSNFHKNIKPIRLTKSCKAWFNDFKKLNVATPADPINLGLKNKLIKWLRSFLLDEIGVVQRLLIDSNFDEAIAETERQLDADSSNGVAHYYRALAIGSKAQEIENPSERKPLYEDTRSSLTDAKRFMEQQESVPGEYDDINELTTTFWAYEHNSGIEYLTEDSVRNSVDTPDQFAMAHFNNAITIQPDSAISYIVLSSTQFNTGDVNSAITTYETAMEKMDRPEVEDYEFLISLYINQEMYDKALPLTQEARDAFPENDQFVQFLADIYIQQGNVDEAISIIENLIEADPENPQYYRVLGTQIYQSVGEINDRISQLYDQTFELEREMRNLTGVEREAKDQELEEVQAEIDELEAESNELTQIAIDQMNEVINLEPEDDDAYNILGIIYQNWAAIIFEKRNSIVDDNQRAQELDQEARETLQQAKQYYEKAAELNPEASEYWESLFQVYTTLGMEEEARNAMERADQKTQDS